MIKRILITIALACLMTTLVQGAGLTVSFMTEQAVSDKGNSLGVELGYFLGIDNNGPGLEPFVGVQWWPRWDDDGDLEPPGVVEFGGRYHFGDILDYDSAIPYIPELLLGILNEEMEAKPFISGRFTINFIDQDAGYMGLGTGILLRTTPESPAAIRFETRYGNGFSQLNGVPDNRLNFYLGAFYQF